MNWKHFSFLLCVVTLTSCKKEPGEGGRAEIRGIVYEQQYNSSTNLPIGDAYPIAEQRGDIIYGDGEYFDDDTRTGPNGEFRFPWLRKGDYRVYVISECDDCPGGTEGIYLDATVNGRKDVVNLGTITVRNY
jgi:hypothetical protein